eukprot:gene23186-29381_t
MPEEEAEDAGGELFISGSHRLGVRISIDLLFARLAENTVPKDIDILDDKILKGLDDATEKSLNGPRVTNMIFKLVGEKTFPNFLIVLRCIRKWAKRRGLYGNKLGYLGGINCNILVAFICQLYPNYGPSSLLFRFFKQYKEWKWPEPIMLNNIQQNPPDATLSEQRVIFSSANNPHDLMPIITPAYPAMNSSYSVNKHTFEVMQREIAKGYDVMETIVKQKGACWDKLFDGSDFFIKYSHYLACHVVGTGQNSDSRSWIGFVESRIRRIVQYPYLENLPLKYPIQLYPVVSKTTKSDYSICYFVGFDLDLPQLAQMSDKNVHIDDVIFRFQENLLDIERGYKGPRVEGLDFFAEHLPWRRLPHELYGEAFGDRESAKRVRVERGYAKESGEKKRRMSVSSSAAGEDTAAAASTAPGDSMEGVTATSNTVSNEVSTVSMTTNEAKTSTSSTTSGDVDVVKTETITPSSSGDKVSVQVQDYRTMGQVVVPTTKSESTNNTTTTTTSSDKQGGANGERTFTSRKRVLPFRDLIKVETLYNNATNNITSNSDKKIRLSSSSTATAVPEMKAVGTRLVPHLSAYSKSNSLVKEERLMYSVPTVAQVVALQNSIQPTQVTEGITEDMDSKFSKIFLLAGNHEYYSHRGSQVSGETIETTNAYIQHLCDTQYKHITFLNDKVELFHSIYFVGTTQWGDLSRINPYVHEINDVHWIRDMTPDLFTSLYQQSSESVVVITHHQPTHRVIAAKYLTPSYRNYSGWFAGSLDAVMEKYDHLINCWIYGHTHEPSVMRLPKLASSVEQIATPDDGGGGESEMSRCWFVCNPVGYPNENAVVDFDKR